MNDPIMEWRRKRLEELAAAMGGKAVLGRALGYKDGAFVGQMIRGERPITDRTIDTMSRLPGKRRWFAGDHTNEVSPISGLFP